MGAIQISDALKLVLLQSCTEDQLGHLYWLKRADSPGMRARLSLSDEAREELAAAIVDGRKLTVGWWRKNSNSVAA